MVHIALVLLLTVQTAVDKEITVDDLLERNSIRRTEGFGGYLEQLLPNIRRMGFTEKQIEILSTEIKKVRTFSSKYSAPLSAFKDGGLTISQSEARKIRDDIEKNWDEFDRNLRSVFDRVSTAKSDKLIIAFQMDVPMEYVYHPPLAKLLKLDDAQAEEIRDLKIQKEKTFLRIMREFDSGRGKGSRTARNRVAIDNYFYGVLNVMNEEQLLRFGPMIRKSKKSYDDLLEFVAQDEFKDDWFKVRLVKKLWDEAQAAKTVAE